MKTRSKVSLLWAYILIPVFSGIGAVPEFSTAGFLTLVRSGRQVRSMNTAWRFHQGSLSADVFSPVFDDSAWPVVSLPHGIEYLPAEASGGVNYQGEVWYRKHFDGEEFSDSRKQFLYFEAIMGKCRIWVNGQPVKEHSGGYLPVIADITSRLNKKGDNVITVWADNSDDPSYPPGKPQNALDFCYFGGIYRDCWLITHNNVFITDPNYENRTAGGGLFVRCEKVGDMEAIVSLKTQIRNERQEKFQGSLEYTLIGPDRQVAATEFRPVGLSGGKADCYESKIKVPSPRLWTPETPYLYRLNVRIKGPEGNTVDGYACRIGIRSIAFDDKDGFVLNGKPYGKPLSGVNRHQDFAVIGNAVPNSLHWRDAKKIREAGFNIVRLSHYPQDPAFMDACDELGLFVIVPTPGWQFWNTQPEFGKHVESDIRNMVRRDRNHPCVLFWEPILNETGLWGESVAYDKNVQGSAARIVREEYPYPGCYPAGGPEDSFAVLYGGEPKPGKTYFIREYGDGGNVNNWHGQNAPNRAARDWGEGPMRIQAETYEKAAGNIWAGFRQSPGNLGGALWHAFDTQRGYHPDPFYGGIMDGFRRPKYAYYLFMSQREVQNTGFPGAGPMVRIAHEMTPFSGSDVTVYSNCEAVRLTVFRNGKQYMLTDRSAETKGLPSPPFVFRNVYDYAACRDLSRSGRLEDVYLIADGMEDGQVIVSDTVFPADRAEKIVLRSDHEGIDLVADGSDMVAVVAEVTDAAGHVKRLNRQHIFFRIEGEGRIVGDARIFANPCPVEWGEAPMLIQSTTQAGLIRIKASVCFGGSRTPIEGELVFHSVPSVIKSVYSPQEAEELNRPARMQEIYRHTESEADEEELRKVQQQQEIFLQP